MQWLRRSWLVWATGLLAPLAAPAAPSFVCAGFEPVAAPQRAAKLAQSSPKIDPHSHVRALVIFADFDDGSGATAPVPAYASGLFDPMRVGSLSHFYHTMSFGEFELTGAVLNKRYAVPRPAQTASDSPGSRGPYGAFVRALIAEVDKDVDFGLYDNDGPDGLPNSGDDDGIVDYLFINLRSVPRGFISGGATGIAGLGLINNYRTADRQPDGKLIAIGATQRAGSIMEEGSFSQTVGVMAHEFGHALDLPDLYDIAYADPASDSAGIGKWGLMGWGAHGWNGGDGPVGFSAWSLERLGWISRVNGRLVELTRPQEIEVADLFAGGAVYKVHLPARTRTVVSPSTGEERLKVDRGYLLLEGRRRDAHYYNRGLPGEGLLVWRVKPGGGANSLEEDKAVDLVCADGLYAADGTARAVLGRDNLDYWAHDLAYAQAHGGNQGDAGDLFDGVRYRHFGRDSNPSILSVGDFASPALSGLALEVRREGAALRVAVDPPRWAGVIAEQVQWSGVVLVDGDVEIEPQGSVAIQAGTEVRFLGGDRLGRGLDPELSELVIEGDFFVDGPVSTRTQPIVLAGAAPGVEWYGLVVDPAESGRVEFPEGALQLRDARAGIVLPGAPPGAEGLTLSRISVFDEASGESAGNGDGKIAPGESVQLVLEMDNWSLTTYRGMQVEVRWDSPFLRRTWGGTSQRYTADFAVTPGGRRQIRLPALSLAGEVPPGESVELSLDVRQGRSLRWSEHVALELAGASPLPAAVLAPIGSTAHDGGIVISQDEDLPLALAADGIAAAEVVVYHREENRIIAEWPMRRAAGQFRLDFKPPAQGAYDLVTRIRSGTGAVGHLPDRLTVSSLFEEWAPVLVMVNDLGVRPRGAWQGVADEVAAELDRRGLASNLLDYDQVDKISTALLSRYVGPGRTVIWLGRNLGGSSTRALAEYLDLGGNLLVSAQQFHLGVGAELGARLPYDYIRTAAPSVLRGRVQSRELAIGNTFYARVNGLDPAALPILFDDEGAVAGFIDDRGGKTLIYYALDLYRLDEGEREALVAEALDFLTVSQAGPQLFIRQVAGVDELMPLGRIAPRVLVENLGRRIAPPFGVWYEVHGAQGPLALRRVDQDALYPGQSREVALPGWTPRDEGRYAVKLVLRDARRGALLDQVERALEAVDVRGQFEAQTALADSLGNGAAFFDYDADGDLDLYVVRLEGTNRLYRNDGGEFAEVAEAAGLADGDRGRALALGDSDSDGDLDLYLVNERTSATRGANRFFRNRGDGRFVDATALLDANPHAAVGLADANSGRSAGFLDYDSDGDLDLYLLNATGGDDSVNRLFRNDAGLFAETAAAVGLDDPGNGRGLAIGDYDADGDPDLYIANQTARDRDPLYRNDTGSGGGFARVGTVAGLESTSFEVGAIFGDSDSDGDLDLFVSNERSENVLWRNDGRRVSGAVGLVDLGFAQVAEGALGAQTVGAAFFDYDNDGDLDLTTTALSRSAGGDELYHNRGDGDLVPAGAILGLRRASAGRGLSWGDYDGDGRQDLLVADAERTVLYRNRVAAAPWLRVELQGRDGNFNALGARVELSADGRRQVRELQSSYGYSSQVQPWLHFGLGEAAQVDSLRVFWPGGQESVATHIGANQRLVLSHPVGVFKAAVPDAFALGRSYPNPFNAEAVIPFEIARAGRVRLEVYNTVGQRVRALVDTERAAGVYQVVWDGRDTAGRAVGSGVYFYRLQVGGDVASRRMLLIK